MNEKAILFFNSLGKTIFWLLISIVFGLSPLVISLLFKVFMPNIELSLTKIIEEGVIMFFCTALCSSVMLDYLLSHIKFSKYIEFIFYAFPFAILLCSGLIFGQLYFHSNDNYDIKPLVTFQNFIIGTTFIYCLTLKMITTINSK